MKLAQSDPLLYRWLVELARAFEPAGGLSAGAQGGINLTNVSGKDHDSLNNIFGGIVVSFPATDTLQDKHISNADYTAFSGNISATATSIKGNNTGATGPVLNLSVSQVLDMVSSTTNAMLVRTISGWTFVAPPTTAGQKLQKRLYH